MFLLVALALPASADDRSIEVVRYGCSGEFGRRDITLFKNGTLRLFQGAWNDQHMHLTELGPETVADNIQVLTEALDSADETYSPPMNGVHGQWMEHCKLTLTLPHRRPFEYEMTQYDIPPLHVSRIIAIVEEMLENFPPPEVETGVPADYRPRRGDVLRTEDGRRFEVVRLTGDRLGVELEAISEPITIYVSVLEMANAFAVLERRGDGPPLNDADDFFVPGGGD